MRTFKQFELGDTKYTLSFDRYTSVYLTDRFVAYLRISDKFSTRHDILLKVYRSGLSIDQWELYTPRYSTAVTGENKSREAKRLILNYLLNERHT